MDLLGVKCEYIDQTLLNLINNSHYLDTADSLKTVFELYFSPTLSLTDGKFSWFGELG